MMFICGFLSFRVVFLSPFYLGFSVCSSFSLSCLSFLFFLSFSMSPCLRVSSLGTGFLVPPVRMSLGLRSRMRDSGWAGYPRPSSPSSNPLQNKPNTVNLLRHQSGSKRRRCSRIWCVFVGCNLRRRSVNLNTSRQISLWSEAFSHILAVEPQNVSNDPVIIR